MRRAIRARAAAIRLSSVEHVIAAALAARVHLHGRDAVTLHHEAGFLATVDLVGVDQALAEFRLEHVGQHDDGRVDFESGEQAGLRQVAQECEHRVVAGVEGKHRAHAQRRVDHHPEAPVSHLRRERLVLGNRSIGPRNRAVEIPEMPDARNALRDALLAFVRGIEAHPEQRYAAIVEQGRGWLQSRRSRRVRRRPRRCRKSTAR